MSPFISLGSSRNVSSIFIFVQCASMSLWIGVPIKSACVFVNCLSSWQYSVVLLWAFPHMLYICQTTLTFNLSISLFFLLMIVFMSTSYVCVYMYGYKQIDISLFHNLSLSFNNCSFLNNLYAESLPPKTAPTTLQPQQ